MMDNSSEISQHQSSWFNLHYTYNKPFIKPFILNIALEGLPGFYYMEKAICWAVTFITIIHPTLIYILTLKKEKNIYKRNLEGANYLCMTILAFEH